MAIGGSETESGASTEVLDVDARFRFKERGDQLGVSVLGGLHQRGLAITTLDVDVELALEQHLHTEPPRISDSGLPCPASLDELIVALLAKDPEDRPFNARVVQGMLNEMLDVANAAIAEPEDRGADTIRPLQASLAARVQAQGERHVTWKGLAVVSMAVAAVVAVLAFFMRDS